MDQKSNDLNGVHAKIAQAKELWGSKIELVDLPNTSSNKSYDQTVETKNNTHPIPIYNANQQGGLINSGPSTPKNNRAMLMKAVQRDGFALMNATTLLKNDKEIVIMAVGQNGRVLDYASHALQKDPEVIKAAILGGRLDIATEDDKSNRNIVMEAVSHDGHALEYASISLRRDKRIVMAAVEQDGHALEYASDYLRTDRDIVLAAVRQDGHALEYACAALRDDEEIVLLAVSHDGSELEFASERLKRDPEIVMAAVKQDGNALDFASKSLQINREVVMAAVKQDGTERVLEIEGSLIIVNSEMVNLIKYQEAEEKKRKTWSWAKFQKHVENVKFHSVEPEPIYIDKTCHCCKPDSFIRRYAIRIAHNGTFDTFILTLILINCLFMIIGSPYAPCCRPSETVAEGGSVVSSWAEAQDGCATDSSTPTLASLTFQSFEDRNSTECINTANKLNTISSFGQGKCDSSGKTKWRNVRNRNSKFPFAPALSKPDFNWKWQTATSTCCVPREWATTHGIYTEQKPESYSLTGPGEKALQPMLCADTLVIDITGVADYIFTAVFTFEMVTKIVASGFFMTKGDPSRHMPGAYLRDVWNWLDFVVVIAALLELTGAGAGITVLRTFRVLRPLRTLNRMPSMKILVRALLRSLAPMVYVLLLMLFVLLLWGIIGTQLWGGLLHGTCQFYDPTNAEADVSGFVVDEAQDGVLCGLQYIPVDEPSYLDRVLPGASPLVSLSGDTYDVVSTLFYEPIGADGLMNDGQIWSNAMDNSTTVARVNAARYNARECEPRIYGDQIWSYTTMSNVTLLQNTYKGLNEITHGKTREIPSMMCRYGLNPYYDLASFDNLGNAILWIFTSITLEGWVDAMYNVNQVWSAQTPLMTFFVEGIYFTFLYLIGSMFMLNLTLAVIWEEFENERARESDDQDMLIAQEKNVLAQRGIEIENREAAELAVRQKRRADAKKEYAGDPIPDPWGPPCIRNYWYKTAISPWFSGFITVAILVNTVTMALDYHDWGLYRATYNYDKALDLQVNANGEALSQPIALTSFLTIMNYVFTFIFVVEMIVKMIGLSLPAYWSDNFNKFDFVIVVFSIVDLVTSQLGLDGIQGLTVLRTFRVLRVLKLAKSWKSLSELLITIMSSLMDVSIAAALALLMMFIFTLLGMEAFGGQWNEESFGEGVDVPRANFDDFLTGFMTVFQVLTGENWNDLLWASYKTSGALGWVYFLSLTFVGNYMIFNLFLAILLAKFNEGAEEAEQDKEDLENEIRDAKAAKKLAKKLRREQRELDLEQGNVSSIVRPGSPSPNSSPTPSPLPSPNKNDTEVEHEDSYREVLEKQKRVSMSHADLENEQEEEYPDIDEEVHVMNGVSLFILSTENKFRQMCFQLATNKKFDQLILILIIVSSIFLAMDEPWVSTCACYDKNDPSTFSEACTSTYPLSWVGYFQEGNSLGYYKFLLYSDMVISIVFTFEMVLKILSFGFAFHQHAYLRNGWNVLDFFIVCVSLVALSTGPLRIGICGVAADASTLKTLRALRIFRALRPLRVIKRDPGLRLVVNSLFLAAAPIGTVTLVTLLFMTILGVLGQQFFVGSVALCNDPTSKTFPDCVGFYTISGNDCSILPHASLSTNFTATEWSTFTNPLHTAQFALDSVEQCELNGAMGSKFPRIWDSLSVNFDSFGHSLTTVYEVASGEMWPDIMVTTIDARGIGQQPLPNTNQLSVFLWYFTVQFMIAFVMLNVFIGVIIEKYNENKAKSEGSGLLTTDQKIWVETMKLALNSKAKKVVLPPVMLKDCRQPFYNFVTKREFDYGIMTCILINVVFMGTSHYNQSVVMHDMLTYVNILFNIIFSVEMVFKWIGLGIQYFYDSWNRFDCFLVILSWIAQTGLLPASIASLFRIFRVARMVRLVRKITGLLNLFKTLIFSLPALKNVAIIMVLFMFIFSCFAMNTFGNVKYGELLNVDANFQTFFLSFNTMWRLTSGESYNGIMHDLTVKLPYCNPSQGGVVDPQSTNCGNEGWAYAIILSSFTMLNYVLVNLFIAIILDNFGDQCSMSDAEVTAEILDEFDETWAKFDPKGTGKIDEDLLPELLMMVEYPLGLKDLPIIVLHKSTLRKYRNAMIQKLDILAVDGSITFVQTKKALTFAAIEDEDGSWDDKIKEGGGSLAMRKIERANTRMTAKLNDKHFRTSHSAGSDGTLISTHSTRRIDALGNEVGFFTVGEINAVKCIQAIWKGKIMREKWKSLIAEAKRRRLKEEKETAMKLLGFGDMIEEENQFSLPQSPQRMAEMKAAMQNFKDEQQAEKAAKIENAKRGSVRKRGSVDVPYFLKDDAF